MFIFARCLRSSAAVTPTKYELDIIQVTIVFIIPKNWENNGTEKIGLVTPTPVTLKMLPFDDVIMISLESYNLGGGGGHFSINMLSYCYRNSHFKDKMVSQLSYLSDGNNPVWKDGLHVDMLRLICIVVTVGK